MWSDAAGGEWPITAEADDGVIRMTIPASVVEKTSFPALLDPTVSSEVAVDSPVTGPVGAQQIQPSIAFDGTNYLAVWSDNRDSSDADIWGTRISQSGVVLDPLGIKIAATVGVQSRPAVAFNGTNYVVAFEDFLVTGGTTSNIVAAKVTPAGVVSSLGTVATGGAQPEIAARPDGQALVTFNTNGAASGSVFNGTSFGAAFQIAAAALVEPTGVAANPAGDYLVTYSSNGDLAGQLVSTAGALDGAAIVVSNGKGTQSASAATFDGTNFDVVFQNAGGTSTATDIFGTRVSTAGAILDTHTEGTTTGIGGISISSATNNQETPSIACQANGCLVTWQDKRAVSTTNYDIFGQLMTSAFAPNGPNFAITQAVQPQESPVVASNGAGYYATWRDLQDDNTFTAFGTTVSSNGALGTIGPIGTGNNRESQPSIGRAGSTFGVFWSDSRVYGNNIEYVRFNASGTRLDASALVASNATFAQITPAASTDLGANTLVVWSDTRNGIDKDIFAARVSLGSGSVLDASGISVTTAKGDQLTPSVASSGTVALAVWADRRSGSSFDIFGALIDSTGAVTVPDIVIANTANDETSPSVTYDTTSGQFIVAFQNKVSGVNHIAGARVSTAGALLDATPVTIASAAVGQFTPSITSMSTESVVVWQDRRNAGKFNIFAARVTGGSALTVLDANGIQLSSIASQQSTPAVSGQGTTAVVVWADNRAGNSDIFAQQINSDGTLAGTEFPISTTTDDEINPAIQALGGTSPSFRVAYSSQRLDTARVSTRLIGAQSGSGTTCSGASQCATGFCVDGYCCDQACGGNHKKAGAAGTGVAGDCHGCAAVYTNKANGTCSAIGPGTICRDYVSSFCDLREYCDGVDLTCGTDVGRNAGKACNKNTNFPVGTGTGTCPANDATGVPHSCQ